MDAQQQQMQQQQDAQQNVAPEQPQNAVQSTQNVPQKKSKPSSTNSADLSLSENSMARRLTRIL